MASLVAAAQRYASQTFGRGAKPADQQAWQTAAWGYYDDTPEVRFAGTWIGNCMGRARLFAGRRMPDGSVQALPPEHRASQLVAEIAGGPDGQAQMLTEFGPHLVTVGEAWNILIPHENDNEFDWHLVSTQEIERSGKNLKVQIDGRVVIVPMQDEKNPDPDSPLAIRIWQPHPRRHIEADSPIRSSFALLEELRLLNAAIAAIAKSRLTGRGIVFIPAGSKFPSSAGDGSEDDLLDTLVTVAETAYSEPDSAAAAVPIFVEIPEGSAVPERLTFESDFDQLAVTLREETIRRFAAGLDTPAEVLLGTGDVNHWGQWAIEDSAIRVAVEPKLTFICNDYTEQWLRPVLESENEPDAAECLVWYDASNCKVRSNQNQTAMELYDRGELSGPALRRITGFNDADAPSEEEEKRQLLVRLVTGAPSLAPVILPLLGIELGLPPEPIDVEGEEADLVEPDIPVGEDQSIPELTESPAAPEQESASAGRDYALLAAAEVMVWRALERAGARLRSRLPRADRGQYQDLAADQIHCHTTVASADIAEHKLLEGAWDRVAQLAARYGADPEDLEAKLDTYTRTLLCAGFACDVESLELALFGDRVEAA